MTGLAINPACFDDLPVELIQLVASFTSYSSIQSLSSTSKRLRCACQDWAVYKGLLRQKHHKTFRYARRVRDDRDEKWRQFALAEFRASTFSVDALDFLLWGPQLLALHHTLTQIIDNLHLLKGINQSSLKHARVYAFCFCVRALSFELPPSGDTEAFYSLLDCKYTVAASTHDWSSRALDPSVFRLSKMGPLWNEDRLMPDDAWPVEQDRMHAIALKALGLLSVEVKSASSCCLLGSKVPQALLRSQTRSSSEFAIPRSNRDIPFGSFMSLPVPFSQSSISEFTRCHLLKMATKEWIEDGGWSGVEFGSRTSLHPRCRVTCVFPFKLAVTITDGTSDVVEMQSSPLTGSESYPDIRIRLRKSSGVSLITVQADVHSQKVHWQGILTPFGFVGTTTLSPGDWFWLWKTSWSGIYRPQLDWTKLWGRGRIDVVQRAMADMA